MVDTPRSSPSAAYRRALPPDIATGVKHAELLGQVMVSPPVLGRIARRCEIPAAELSGLARITANVPASFIEPDSERRASEIRGSNAPYRLETQGRPYAPVIDVFAQAPTAESATCLADSSAVGLGGFVRHLGRQQGVPPQDLARLRPIGGARGGVVNARAPVAIALLTFIVAFGLTAAAIACLIGLRRRRLARRQPPLAGSTHRANGVGAPTAPAAPNGVEPVPTPWLEDANEADRDNDNWPRTARPMPWLLAGFLAVLWLVPFNSIELNATVPIDLPLDRLILPVIAVAWLVALAARGRFAPRFRPTGIHLALGAFLACALLSVVLDAHYLNQTLELELSLKGLATLVSYVLLFAITASVVRRAEVRPFLTYTLILAVICALGMIYEYRFEQNLFWEWSDRLLPGAFNVTGQLEAGPIVDDIGRRLVFGPAEVSLEAVAMLTLAIPIAVVRLLDAERWRERLIYGLAACILVAAILATYRKSAFVAPAAVLLALAYYRRRDLLRLAPLAMVLVVLVTALSPGALTSILDQFVRSDRTSLTTVSDRVSDYDAIRPDVWTHLIFGRGWGSYNHESYRILDSEILHRLVETGVIGLIAFLAIGISVLAATRRPIAMADRKTAQVALIGALGAVAFLVFALLFDTLSFPHVPYIFLYVTGLVTVAIAPWKRRSPAPAPPIVRQTRTPPREPAKSPRTEESLVSLR